MSITVTDLALLEQLDRAAGLVELKSPDGRLLGQFIAADPCKLPPGVKSPFTEEQLVARRMDRSGRPLAEILRDLQSRP